MQSRSAAQRDGVRKRPRKIWSCLECRRKKLQCDHGLPACGRCTRAGSAANCVYATVTPTSSNSEATRATSNQSTVVEGGRRPASTNQPGRTVDSELLSRLESLEETLWSFQTSASLPGVPRARQTDGSGQLPSPEGTNEDADTVAGGTVDTTNILLRGSAFRTKFNGNTCTVTLAEHVPGISTFKKDALATFPAFDQVQQYLNKTEHRTILTPFKPNLSPDENVKVLLPPQPEADRLVRIYMESFDYIYPILHQPTFEECYSQLWTGTDEVDTRFVAVVILIIAISDCLTSTPFTSTASTGQISRAKATSILDTVEQWVHHKVYQYESILDFQIQFLLLLGRQLNGKRNKRTWANAGGMVRTFMCTGMHRDPEDLAKETTAVDRMMRRRIWAAAIEFELQAAFEHGMPACPWAVHSDIGPPLNTLDDDVENVLPFSSFTKTSFLAVSWKSLNLRHQLCSILNDMNSAMTPHNRAVTYTDTLKQLHQACPKWDNVEAAAARALLCINIHQFILAIHEQQLLNSTSSVEKQLSRMIMVDSATQMLDAHKAARDSGSDLVELLYNDHMRAALSICHAYITADPLADRFLISAIDHTISRVMDNAIAMYTEKVMRFGGSKLDLWYIVAADGLMKSTADPTQRATYVQRAVDHFTRPFYRLMALTRDPMLSSIAQQATSSTADQIQLLPRPDDTITSERLEDMSLPGFGELAEWTFDDFAFDPNDFLELGAQQL
ncbi:hypothetical protein PRZ48_006164 [Zasmidium cellare]|uniref:Zn(2)-C6 fungal-type domain-containing protein n=1 Tax=Zasmidium cellare TaxID=395010 RepID=A0ABR0ENQ5_ZASCE|nr:hypothetical protein PRZ48_006164 [Zasmidium cellare]